MFNGLTFIWEYFLEMVDEREIESDSSDEETESDDSEDERQRVALREMEERIGSIPERREEKLSKRKVRFFSAAFCSRLTLRYSGLFKGLSFYLSFF